MIEGANKRQGSLQEAADIGRESRMKEILERGMAERAQMAAEGLRAEERGNWEMPRPFT